MSVAPGLKLSHFLLEEEIGSGGMGVVFRARDLHLERDVAIKVLPAGTLTDPAARTRFRKEALALSKLNHPAIATVFDFDTQDETDFLVMEYVPGTSLDEKLAGGALAESEIVALSTQLLDGLAMAHAQGIVHRDLKPANLRVMPDGRLKILDFGLVKLLRTEGEEDATETVTQTRGMVGTFPYMAPEQIQGGRIDARTDLYATGTVLYEMATGRRPFRKTKTAQLLYAIAHESPESPRSLSGEISTGLESVILKALEKDPTRRYQSATELEQELQRLGAGMPVVAPRPVRRRAWRWAIASVGLGALVLAALVLLDVGGLRGRLTGAATSGPRITSLAVLPLDNLSGDPEKEYFAEAMTETLITDLGKIGTLTVIGRQSVRRFKDSNETLQEIAGKLGVQALVVGSVAPVGDRVRITAQLVQASTEQQLWAERYDRDLRDILVVQGEIARAIARRIEAVVTPEEQASLTTTRSIDPEAHRAYLRGRSHVDKFTKQGFLKAIESFERAIQIDSGYAEAYASLGYSRFAAAQQKFLTPKEEVMSEARLAVDKALELDDTSVEAWLTLGLLEHIWEWDWQEAEPAYRRAIELNPNHAYAHSAYAYYLVATGRQEEAVAEARRGVEVDPLSLISGAHLVEILLVARRYDEAIEECERVLELDPNFARAQRMLIWIYEDTGRYEEAMSGRQKVCVLSGHKLDDCLRRQQGWEPGGDAEGYWRFSHEVDIGNPRPAAYLGKREEALASLERQYEGREGNMVLGLLDGPAYDSLRDDPRFQDLRRRIGLPGE